MNLIVTLASEQYLPEYTNLLQKTYEFAYVNDDIGLTKKLFSIDTFLTLDSQNYLRSNIINSEKQKSWFAFIDNKLVGSIAVVTRDNDYELKGFYVDPEYQGKGIGRKLWEKVLEFVKDMGITKDITLDIYAHNTRTIQIYKKWGFEVDKVRKSFYRHWSEWPENVKAKVIYMRYKVK